MIKVFAISQKVGIGMGKVLESLLWGRKNSIVIYQEIGKSRLWGLFE
jgi:hypothetical protein